MQPFGCGDYVVQVAGRGGSPIRIEVPFSSLRFTMALDQVTQASVSVPVGAVPYAECCEVFAACEPWRDELVIYRDGTSVWSGPVVRRAIGPGGGELDASDHMVWMDRRFVERDMHLQGDLAYIFGELWRYGYEKDDSFNVSLVARDCGVDGVRNLQGRDFLQVSSVLSELARTGLDWWMDGGTRRLLVGGPDVFAGTPVVLHDDAVADISIDEDGTQFATDVAVFAGATRTGGQPVYGRATRSVSVYGLIQSSFTELLIKDVASANANALARLESSQPAARRVTAPLTDRAGFGWSDLVPGRRIDARISEAAGCLALEQVMRVPSIEVSVNVSETGFEERVSPSLVPVGSSDA